MDTHRWLLCGTLAGLLVGCAPTLRDQDVTALAHVQGDLARRYSDSATAGPDKEIFKVEYCEIDAVVVAAGKTTAGKVPCK